MLTENFAAQETHTPPARNPFHLLDHLYNAIIGLDRILAPQSAQITDPAGRRRLIYLRNTLAVSLDLWQDDLRNRISRSRGTFYTYCMTEGERAAFIRRMVPAFTFAAEELRAIDRATLNHLAGAVEQCALDVETYCEQNRACLKVAIRTESEYPFLSVSIIPLPRIENSEPSRAKRSADAGFRRTAPANPKRLLVEKKRLASTA